MNTLRLATVAATATALAGAAVLAPALASAAPATSVPACTAAQLTIQKGLGQGATGHSDLALLFKNKSKHTCSLRGYPGVDAQNIHGKAIAHAKRTVSGFTGGSRNGVRTIVIKPGKYASADLEWLNFNPKTSGNCATSHYIAVTAANTSTTVRFVEAVTICGLQIHPTVAGKTGSN